MGSNNNKKLKVATWLLQFKIGTTKWQTQDLVDGISNLSASVPVQGSTLKLYGRKPGRLDAVLSIILMEVGIQLKLYAIML